MHEHRAGDDGECHDLSLLRRALSNDHSAWDEFQQNVLPWLQQKCERLCGKHGLTSSEAEDVCFNVLFGVIRQLKTKPTFLRSNSCDAFRGYLGRAARNEVIAKVRKKIVHQQWLAGQDTSINRLCYVELDTDAKYTSDDTACYLLLIGTLKHLDRFILEMWQAGATYKEIGEMTNKGTKAIAKRIERLLDALTKFAKRMGFDDPEKGDQQC